MTRATAYVLLFLGPQAFAGEFDVCVYGGTAGGVAAAIQSARMGKSVVLIEPSQHVGGMTSGGLGWTDSGDKSAVGGIAREFYQRVKKHYDDPAAWKFGKREDYKQYRPGDDAMWTFEPHVAERILREMLKAHKVEVVTGERLRQRGCVIQIAQTRRIIRIETESDRAYRASVYIDATYEGDLMRAA
ncbi:MAG TPA: FAD-dependent oxidoreductase, partial [Gemmataceae bacterium]|nr:FAD-dependent oxidoreductase [Gemmataceae bacterium]